VLATVLVVPNVLASDGSRQMTSQGAGQIHSQLERRVALMSKELDLDAGQQDRLRELLQRQRKDILQLWSDHALPAAQRVAATDKIAEHTGDAVRAMLSEEQRKKYNKARSPELAGAPRPSIDDWQSAGKHE